MEPRLHLRQYGWEGSYLPPHRAFRSLRVTPVEVCAGTTLAIAATAAWILLLPSLARFWAGLLSFWIKRLRLGGAIVLVDRTILGHWHVAVPYFEVTAGPTTGWISILVTAMTALLFALSFKIPKDRFLPGAYLLRAVCLIQSTALIYAARGGRHFPHAPAEYCTSMLLLGIIFVGLVPIMLALTYYIFDVDLSKKLAVTVITMAHLAMFIPLQYLLHAWLLHQSLLFMPVLYFVFGPFLDIIILIGFYSWAMSWS